MVRRPGRPNGWMARLERMEGDPIAKQRAHAVVQTIREDVMVKDACAELAISRSRFQQLSDEGLEALLAAMHFGQPGRPPKSASPPTAAELAVLRAENERLRHELELARTEIELLTRLGAVEARRQGKLAVQAQTPTARRKLRRR